MFLVIYHELSLVKCLSSKISKFTMTWTVSLRTTRLDYLQSRDETVAMITNHQDIRGSVITFSTERSARKSTYKQKGIGCAHFPFVLMTNDQAN
jgi:hypothetical protein